MNKIIRYLSVFISSNKDAISFYTEFLDFILVENVKWGNDEQWWILKASQQEKTGVALICINGEKHERGTLIINTTDCILEYCKLKDKGLAMLSTPVYSSLGLSFYFHDPSGNKIIILEERAYNDKL